MIKRIWRGAGLIWFAGLLGACAPSLPPVDSGTLDAIRGDRPWATLADLQEGRRLFAGRCGACHGLPEPKRYTPEKWPGLVASMAKPAQIDTAQARKILDWVLSRQRQDARLPDRAGKSVGVAD